MLIELKTVKGVTRFKAAVVNLTMHRLSDEILFMELYGESVTALNAIFAHLAKFRRGDYMQTTNLFIDDEQVSTYPYTRYNRIFMGKNNMLVVQRRFSAFDMRGVLSLGNEAIPPRFLRMMFNTMEVPFLEVWEEWLWKTGLENESILEHSPQKGNVYAYTPYHLSKWPKLITKAVQDGILTQEGVKWQD